MSDAPALIDRFYKDVSVSKDDEGFCILLDGRQARTRSRHVLIAPTQALAKAIADEWDDQGDHVDQHSMPLTGLLSASIDGGAEGAQECSAEVVNYLRSDLTCYRADRPEKLVAFQNRVWDPYLDWVRKEFGAPLKATTGIVTVSQPDSSLQAIKLALQDQTPATLFALKTATSITGSAVLALALWKSSFGASDIFNASRVDEQFQEEQWGSDAEAKDREASMRSELLSVERFLSLI